MSLTELLHRFFTLEFDQFRMLPKIEKLPFPQKIFFWLRP